MSNEQDWIRQARDAIGEGKPGFDWKATLTEHSTSFATAVPSLAACLRGSKVKQLADLYEEWNAKATQSRDEFKHTVGRANKAIFWTASASALLLTAGGLQEVLGRYGPWLVRAIGLLGITAATLAAMWLSQAKDGALDRKWLAARAKAEAKRLAYFKAVLETPAQTPVDRLLTFEYTRRFLLDSQIDYFKDQGGQHEQGAAVALKTSTMAIFIASVLAAIAAAFSMWRSELAVIAGLGVIASAYAALASSRTKMNQDRRNSDRYQAARDQLTDRKQDLDIYRAKVAAGDGRAAEEFFEPIFVALKADHQAFLGEQEQRDLAIGDMSRRLDAAKQALDENAAMKTLQAVPSGGGPAS